MIKATSIKPGDRIGVPAHGGIKTRTVLFSGDDYVTVHICGSITKVPEHKISSHIKVDQKEVRRRA